MANENGDKPGANDDADDKSKQSASNTDDAGSGKNAADKNKSDDGKSGDEKPNGKFYTQDEIDSIVQTRIKRATKDAEDKAKLSKEQLLESERDAALHKAHVSDARDSFIEKSGIRDYPKATRLFRMYSSDLEFDDNGKPSNLADIIKSAKADWPEYFGKVAPGGGDLDGGKKDGEKSSGSDMNSMLRKATGRNS